MVGFHPALANQSSELSEPNAESDVTRDQKVRNRVGGVRRARFELSDTEEDLDYAANDEEDPGTESGEATTPTKSRDSWTNALLKEKGKPEATVYEVDA
ncbi:hypothetical protein JG688_00007132 [Phytophthora aleatoria]|uniref:Uncharacterized protein n=1 Tax=Phytophthora aleatoria TaxID=2496075 RepID=A0A8J5ILW4_9STRA|nr:hypothetical protein JG688_00007132 [Phytophthora aleatoria]